MTLDRFLEAQNGVYEQALAELRAGHKRSHWIWFVFPQVAGLGHSEMSRRFAIASLEEAQEYVAHAVLGPRLEECAHAVLSHRDRSALSIMGSPDDAKLRSSMTLFAAAAPDVPGFREVLDAFFDGRPDPRTEAFLAAERP